MKKGYKKILIFEIVLLFILVLNSFIENILNRYIMVLFLCLTIFIFKKIFGIEKDRHRYTKDIIMEIIMIYIVSFIVYYIFGVIIGFYKNDNYLNLYGLKNFIIPIILTTVLKEYFRYNIIQKVEGSTKLYILTIVLMVMFDITGVLSITKITKESIFDLISLTILPSISNNIVASYITKNNGYKPNLVWLMVTRLYIYIFPIIPNTGQYILSLIEILYPFVLIIILKRYYDREEDKHIERNYKKKNIIPYIVSALFVSVIVYFTSGHFRYYAIAIGSGSMSPKIEKGDVVIVDTSKKALENVKVGQVLAYKHENITVVHRIIKIEKYKDEKLYYSKGDHNNDVDNYVIYEKDLVGIVKGNVKFVGLPTVWLSEI